MFNFILNSLNLQSIHKYDSVNIARNSQQKLQFSLVSNIHMRSVSSPNNLAVHTPPRFLWGGEKSSGGVSVPVCLSPVNEARSKRDRRETGGRNPRQFWRGLKLQNDWSSRGQRVSSPDTPTLSSFAAPLHANTH